MVRLGDAARVAACALLATALSVGSLGSLGCKGSERPAGEAGEATAGQEALGAQEDELLKRRDALLSTRLELRSKRAELDQRRQAIRAEGGDTSEIDRTAQELLDQEGALVDQEKELNQRLDALLGERRAMISALASGGGEAANLAGREAALASREKDLARREQRVGEREAALSSREEGLASKWKDSCAAGGTTTIVQTVDAKGSKYSKKDVDPLLARARAEMQKKGILKLDLPDPVRHLESEATQAMEKGDYGQARFAASQLLGTVRSMQVDKAFISAKIGRLNGILKGKPLSGSVEQLFRQATEDVADGNFAGANRKLNQIHSQIN
jgi:hypothetical protein